MKNIKINIGNLVEQFRLSFPEVEACYQEEISNWKGEFPGNYNVFAFVFKPFLKRELIQKNNSEFLRRLCIFMERVCSSEDLEAINVIWLKFFTLILEDRSFVKMLWPFMGLKTRENLAEAALRKGMIRGIPAFGLVSGLKHWAGL